jgi:hypothetical protein
MQTTLTFIAVVAVVAAGSLPFVFLWRHPGKKMDLPPYRHWLVAMITLAAVSGVAVVVHLMTR